MSEARAAAPASSDPLAALWDKIKSLPGKTEGGLEELWNRVKSGAASAGDPEASYGQISQPAVTAAGKAAAGYVREEAKSDVDLVRNVLRIGGIPSDVWEGKVPKEQIPGAAREFMQTFMLGGAPRGALGSGGAFRFSSQFTDAQLRQMLPDALKGGVIHKGDGIEDLRKALDEMGSHRTAWDQPEAPQQPQPEAPSKPAAPAAPGVPGAGKPPPPAVGPRSASKPSAGSAVAPAMGGGPVGPPRPPEPPPPPRTPTEPEAGEPASWTAEPVESTRGPSGESPATRRMRLAAMHRLSDDLYSLHARASSRMGKFMKTFGEDLPHLTPEENRQVERAMEWQPGMPKVPAPSSAAQYTIDRILKPANDRLTENWLWLKSKGAVPPEQELLTSLNEGYLHRIVISPHRPYGNEPFAPFGGVHSLRQRIGSMQKRQGYMLQNAQGDRMFRRGEPPGPYFSKVPETGPAAHHPGFVPNQWEIRRATMEEMEANTDVRYLHDPTLATLHELQQSEIARANVEMLHSKILPDLDREGLASTDPASRQKLGFVESRVPVLKGHFFEPRLARTFDDFYRTPSIIESDRMGEMGNTSFSRLTPRFGWLGSLNRFAIATMFLNPIGHMRNVASDYALARGGLWFSPPAYARMVPAWRQAWTDVWNKTPFYHSILEHSGSLMGMDASNRVAFEALMIKIHKEMLTDPVIARMAAETPWKTSKNFARSFYNASQKGMWFFHDFVMVARARELMMGGMPLERAIPEAERFIANYRVPATVGESTGRISLPKQYARTLSRLSQDRTVQAFPRYRYNKLAGLGRVLSDAWKASSNSGMTGRERMDALERLAYMLMVSTVLQYGINFVLQKVSGNPEARAHVPGAMGIPANLARVADDMFKGEFGEANYDFWMTMATLISPAPALVEMGSQALNRDLVTGGQIAGPHLSAWQQARERIWHGTRGLISPIGEGQEIGSLFGGSRPLQGAVPSLGLSFPDPQAAAKARAGPSARSQQIMRRGEQRHFERTVPWWLGGGTPRGPTTTTPPP